MKKLALFASAVLMSFQAQAALVSVSGDGEFIKPISVQEDSPTNRIQQGFNELQGVVLTKDIDVDGGIIAKGTKVDSHLIFLNSQGNTLVKTNAKWSFSGDILGVMVDKGGNDLIGSNDQLAAFNDYFTVGSNTGTFNALGLELGNGNNDDSFSILGNMLTLEMNVTEPGDWIRVVTVSQVPVPAALWLFAPALMGFMGLRRKSKQA